MLHEVHFLNAIIDRAIFCYSNIKNADFSYAKLAVANFNRANINNTSFEYANLNGANFCNATLNKTKFFYSDLSDANFKTATLYEVDFRHANLARANLSEVVEWRGCIMDDACLKEVNLIWFDLDDSDVIEMLSKADLTEADWTGVTEEQKMLLYFNQLQN